MPALYYQSTRRWNQSLVHAACGRRARLFERRDVAEVIRRRRRGHDLSAAIRQFDDDEIDAAELRDLIDDAGVDASRVNGYLGRLIADHLRLCDDCGGLRLPDDCTSDGDSTLCESCRENYYSCEHCDSLTHGNDVTYINDAAVCDSCRDRHYHYWESDDQWHSEPEDDALIREYNVTLTGPIGPTPVDRRAQHVLGAELELEIDDPEDFAAALDCQHDPSICHCKRDGSLDSAHGVEVVTGYGTLGAVLPVLESVAALAKSHDGRSHDGNSCGLHIGLDRSQFAAALQAKIIVFWNCRANYPFLRQFTRRDYRSNDYCRAKAEKATSGFLANPDLASGDKYEIVNTRHRSHLEFRAFRGSLLPRTLRACLSLVSLVATFCDQANPEPNDLTGTAFVAWLQSVDAKDPRRAAVADYLAHRGKALADFSCA